MTAVCHSPVPDTEPLRPDPAVRIERHTSVEQLPLEIWDRLALRSAVGLESGHLRAVQEARVNAVHPYYLIGWRNQKPIGIAYCFTMDLDLTKLVTEDPPDVIAAVKQWKPGFMQLRILELGHVASLGSAIEAPIEHKTDFLDALAEEVQTIARLENADLGVVRDIPAESWEEFRVLEANGYHATPGFPIARMQLDWASFDGYLAALKSKKRRGVRDRRAAFERSGLTVEIIDDYAPYAERLAELWEQVARRHGEYEHEWLTPAYFTSMARCLGRRSHVIAVKHADTIVAFGLGLIGDDDYFGVAEGMDDSFRDSHEVYANIIFETIRVACELGKKTLNLGITTYDFKTALGAELASLVYFVKAFKQPDYSGAYAELFRKGIRQPENRHRAFAGGAAARTQPAAVSLHNRGGARDVFAKLKRYARANMSRAAGLYAYCPPFASAQEPIVNYEEREIVMLGTNSYLGLATHPEVKEAAHAAIDKYGTGCSGSPMLNGTLDLHEQLTHALACFMRKEDALVFPTGYQTNLGAISALVGKDDVILLDERNHASIVDAARLSRATIVRYKHADLESLSNALHRHPNAPKLVVTDSLFSMEGTVIDLPGMLRLTRRHGARLMLDESHAIGVLGPTGRGVAEHYGLLDAVDIVMGTFSKSFASVGGFVASESKIIDALKHTARSFIFSASLPPAAVGAVLSAMRIVEREPDRRARLLDNARFLAEGLQALGYRATWHGGAIVPVWCGNELLAMAAFHELFEQGVFVNPVVNPAVPRHQEMLRLSPMATHTRSMLERALDVFAHVRTLHWPERTSRSMSP